MLGFAPIIITLSWWLRPTLIQSELTPFKTIASKTIDVNALLEKMAFFLLRGEFFVFGEHSPRIPEVSKRIWDVKPFNYDNCAAAMMTLFAVQTSEGWVAILQDSMSSTYEDEGPIPWFRTEMAIFYIVYFVVFPFFFVNIFVALVIVTFNELGEAELTEDIDKNQVRPS